jgi:hypothetical protein
MSEITGPVSEINYNGVAVPLSAGEKLYQHNIKVDYTGTKVNFIIKNNSPEIMTPDAIKNYLKNNGFTTSAKAGLLANGSVAGINNKSIIIVEEIKFYEAGNSIYYYGTGISVTVTPNTDNPEEFTTTFGRASSQGTITLRDNNTYDTVVEL